MEETKKNKVLRFALVVAKYVVTLLIGAIGGSDIVNAAVYAM